LENYIPVFPGDNQHYTEYRPIVLLDLLSGIYKNLPLSSPILQDYPLKTPLQKNYSLHKEYKNERGVNLGFSISLKQTLLQEKDI